MSSSVCRSPGCGARAEMKHIPIQGYEAYKKESIRSNPVAKQVYRAWERSGVVSIETISEEKVASSSQRPTMTAPASTCSQGQPKSEHCR